TDAEALTGCTVVLCEQGAVGGVEVRGGAAGTHGLETLRVFHLVPEVHGLVLTGGSGFGLASVTGVMEYLEARGVGFDVGVAKVPIVAGAVVFDLNLGDGRVRPDAAMGRTACENASEGPIAQGNVGAGTGATIGKLFGIEHAMKGGLGTASARLANDLIVAALAVVNAFGDVIDPRTGEVLAGARNPLTGRLADTAACLKRGYTSPGFARPALENTTLGVVATNARLTKVEANKVAQMAHNGLARSLSPVHTLFDGDTVFALAIGEVPGEVNIIGTAAAEVLAEAVVNAVKAAESVETVLAWRDLAPSSLQECGGQNSPPVAQQNQAYPADDTDRA
ncbi:MAG TPA: peptidase S58 family protein, partial [Armatimonadetes bacterium]|nr:peptidase S58 family protein [Armatimonadota bacterium]